MGGQGLLCWESRNGCLLICVVCSTTACFRVSKIAPLDSNWRFSMTITVPMGWGMAGTAADMTLTAMARVATKENFIMSACGVWNGACGKK